MRIWKQTVLGCAVGLIVSAVAVGDDAKAEKWFGTLSIGGGELRIGAEVTPGENGDYTGQLISMDQNNVKMKFDSFTNKDNELRFEVKSVGASFVGKLNEAGDTATGTFTQGQDVDFTFRKVDEFPRQDPQVLKEAWVGTIDLGVQKLKLQFRVVEGEDGKDRVLLDSLSQGAMNIKATMENDGQQLKFTVPAVGGTFEGDLNEAGDTADGIWSQGAAELGLELKKQDTADKLDNVKHDRPQHPQEPFPYEVQTVEVENAEDHLVLAGTLTCPKSEGPFPAVVLVTGSGPQDRDESLLGHKPFLVIADHLTRNGIAVLRYDDRGTNQSTGDFASATSEDFAADAKSVVEFLLTDPRIDANRVGIVGHSEGGLIATMLAASMSDLAHVVLLAGPGVGGDEILTSQTEAISKAVGVENTGSDELGKILAAIKSGASDEELETLVNKLADEFDAKAAGEPQEKVNAGKLLRQKYKAFMTPWFRYFIGYDPRPHLQTANCPVLALIGENDLQVLADVNLPEIEKALSQSSVEYQVTQLDGLNHLFQTSETGSPTEYEANTETFSPVALHLVSDWIHRH